MIKGVVVGEGDTFEESLSDVNSAICFHIETFVGELLEGDLPIMEASVSETML